MAVLAATLLLLPDPGQAETASMTITGELKVFDGDTLEVGPLVIRLYGRIISCFGGAFGSRAV